MLQKRKFLAWMLVFAAVMIFVAIAVAAPKRVLTAKGGDCAACHGQEKVLSPSHVDTKDMTYKDCLGCHDRAGPQKLTGKLPGSHVHQLTGITCAKCHGKEKKEE
ncbi:MAG TPA: cytochrome c3 family protein, partial [Syntrophorhabdaceae bacterium]|nr:cytochrome c3 family protein [Syntrophorhabdaceae bacterium]